MLRERRARALLFIRNSCSRAQPPANSSTIEYEIEWTLGSAKARVSSPPKANTLGLLHTRSVCVLCVCAPYALQHLTIHFSYRFHFLLVFRTLHRLQAHSTPTTIRLMMCGSKWWKSFAVAAYVSAACTHTQQSGRGKSASTPSRSEKKENEMENKKEKHTISIWINLIFKFLESCCVPHRHHLFVFVLFSFW